ncbi:fumarate reductase [Shewanella sp. NFH-SH190041]|uniref:fumarate reductase cytochrome b subunit n=1 Tax=Shewanella sp. NFH-SH190041 TaxID=2950245 RepID=UPI0021C272B6|nr:fumarate reductase cytochrome b subunit [Shewanella sp. NFH-SH190041]BDM62956.1 fumarate reductase [Shewanella sp. NFH-SH190041]
MTTKTYVPNPISPRLLGHRRSAYVDRLQSATGVLMGVFLLFHLHFESSILLGKDAFYHVVHFLEGSLFSDDGKGFPVITQFISVLMLAVFVLHALTALRRFPAQLGQWRALQSSLRTIRHSDTRIWYFQLLTGAALFFLVPVHLFEMIQAPAIGPHMSAERVYHDNTWLLYVLLLPAVVVHAVFGLYRVAVKWGVSSQRATLLRLAKGLLIYLLLLGIASLICYVLIGTELTLPVTPFSPD